MINQTTKNLASKQAHVCSRHKPTRKGFCSKNHPRRHAPLLHKKNCICVFCSLIVALLAAGCGNSASSGDADGSSTTGITEGSSSAAEIEALPQIVTTIDIWGDIADKATCGQAEVSTIIPSGSDPHIYSPSARDIIALEDAALVVENGYELEEGLLDALSSAPNKLVIADLIEEEDNEHEDEELEDHEDEDHGEDEHEDHDEELEEHDDEFEDHDHAHDHSGGDPHIWFDFNFARSFVDAMETRLAPAVADADELAACADSYIAELQETEDAVVAALASVPQGRRLLVTQHDTLQRLADRHGYEIVGSVTPSASTLSEADLRHLIELEDEVQARGGVPAVFADATGVNSDMETFAERVGLPLVVLYTESLGAPGSGADTYTGLMLTNANLIAEALASP